MTVNIEFEETDFDELPIDMVEEESSDDDVANTDAGSILSQTKHITKAVDDDPLSGAKHSDEDESSDALHFVRMTKWHPFMYLFHDCATSTHLDKVPGARMRYFSKDHPFFLKICMVADFLFTLMCVFITVLAMLYALAKLTGFVFPWEAVACCKQACFS